MDLKRQETAPEPFPTVEDEAAATKPQEPSAVRHSIESAPVRHSVEYAPVRHSLESAPDRPRSASIASIGAATRTRASSIAQFFLESNPPNGMWQATGEVASKIPTLGEIRSGAFSNDGWTEEGQRERRGEAPHEIHRSRRSTTSTVSQGSRMRTGTTNTPGGAAMVSHDEEDEYFPVTKVPSERIPSPIREHDTLDSIDMTASDKIKGPSEPAPEIKVVDASSSDTNPPDQKPSIGPDETGTYPNGYRFPPKHTWTESIAIGLKAFWKFTLTPFGFIIVIYGLNVVAWGAMIFFLLLKAAPAMCHPSCDALDSPLKKWIEVDSQVLNGLFCVTGLGLIPWRFRDLYWLLGYRLFGSQKCLRLLAGIHRGWFRLPGSQDLDPNIGPAPPSAPTKSNPNPLPPLSAPALTALTSNPSLPLPPTSIPPAPLTGVRAPDTKRVYLLDLVVWAYVFNTFFQIVLCAAMWSFNRFNRPAWLEAFAITCACCVAIAAGLIVWRQGAKVKKVEGVPVHEEEVVEGGGTDIDVEKATAAAVGEKNAEGGDDGRLKVEGQPQQTEGTTVASGKKRKVVEVKKHKGRHWYERH